jgi:hypothetical protein
MQAIGTPGGPPIVRGGRSRKKEKSGDAAQTYVIVVTNDRLLHITLVDGDGVMVREFLDAPARWRIQDTSMGTRDGWVRDYDIVGRVAADGNSCFGKLEAAPRLGTG